MKQQGTFEEHLQKSNLSENTIHSYLWTVDFYHAHYDEINKENLLAYKGYLMEFFKPKTVNLRIQAMNKYLNFLHKDRLRLKAVKVQQKNFLENVISNADYNFLKKQLKKDDNMEWYFVVWYLAATGARVSELIQIKIEHVELGYFDLYTKGGKLRRLYIPKKLRTETLEWLEETHRSSGYLFLNRYGVRITTRGISQQLKNYADKYGLDKKVVYPHSFRHRYAKNFLEKYNDIALQADLMGHESNGPRILRPCGLLHWKLRHHRQPGQHHSVHGADGLAPVRDLRQSKCVTRRGWIVRAYCHRSPSTRQPRICCANSPCEPTRARSSQTSKLRMFKLNIH